MDAHHALDRQCALVPPVLDDDGRADGEIKVTRRHALHGQRPAIGPIALQQLDGVHALRLIVGSGDDRPIAPLVLAFELPAKAGVHLPFGVGDAGLAQHRLDDVPIEPIWVHLDVGCVARLVALRHARAHHA